MPANEIPKEKLLLKFLNLTTSNIDSEALAALRKANKLLQESNWSWEKLLTNKITIIEDPFKNLATPSGAAASKAPPTPPSPSPPPPPEPQTWRPPNPNPTRPGSLTTPVNSRNLNSRNGPCYNCGAALYPNCGFSFIPVHFNKNAPNGAANICDLCNSNSKLFISAKSHAGAVNSLFYTSHADFCYCCGAFTQGSQFNPNNYNIHAPFMTTLICHYCNLTSGLQISAAAAPRKKATSPQPKSQTKLRQRNHHSKPAPNISDL